MAIEAAPDLARALGDAEAPGVLRDHPTPRGCTSPFAPIWVSVRVKRQQA